MHTPHNSPLGRATPHWPQERDPVLLYPLPRARGRQSLGLGGPLPFVGADVWNAYELSWLDLRGKPRVALAELHFDAASPCIVESKSLKLYLGSYAQTHIESEAGIAAQLATDLGAAAGSPVRVHIVPAVDFATQRLTELCGIVIDALPVTVDCYGPPNADLLRCVDAAGETEQTLVSHLLRSNCPVTGQPDWASVQIHYRGPLIDHASVLRYLISYRQHAGFHEQCVERMFVDILRRCAPRELDIHARYTRRGGIDINPWRSMTRPQPPTNPRSARQ